MALILDADLYVDQDLESTERVGRSEFCYHGVEFTLVTVVNHFDEASRKQGMVRSASDVRNYALPSLRAMVLA